MWSIWTRLFRSGKYKGQPVVALAQDQQYAEWLVSQPWFRERYATIYNVIINNFGAASEDTPQHNALQALFLDEAYCRALVVGVFGWPRCEVVEEVIKLENIKEPDKYDDARLAMLREVLEDVGLDRPTIKVGFEVMGMDIVIEVYSKLVALPKWYMSKEFLIEVKPTVGDDYPTVLRQVKSYRCLVGGRKIQKVLFVGEYVGEGVTREQFIKIFNNEGIHVVFRSNIS